MCLPDLLSLKEAPVLSTFSIVNIKIGVDLLEEFQLSSLAVPKIFLALGSLARLPIEASNPLRLALNNLLKKSFITFLTTTL